MSSRFVIAHVMIQKGVIFFDFVMQAFARYCFNL
jgi:hypothetical protein